MNPSGPAEGHGDAGLLLFVTGDAPRSERARANLARALEALGADVEPREIDLLAEPGRTVEYGVFASPALMHVGAGGEPSVLYGDLSDEPRLKRFLAGVAGTRPD